MLNPLYMAFLIIGIIGGVLGAIGTVFTISDRYVTKRELSEKLAAIDRLWEAKITAMKEIWEVKVENMLESVSGKTADRVVEKICQMGILKKKDLL